MLKNDKQQKQFKIVGKEPPFSIIVRCYSENFHEHLKDIHRVVVNQHTYDNRWYTDPPKVCIKFSNSITKHFFINGFLNRHTF